MTNKFLLPAVCAALWLIGCASPKAALDALEKTPDTKTAFESYGDFADNYKNDPESVRALFKRGEILEKDGKLTDAKIEYTRAIERNRTLEQKNERFATASLYRLSNLLFDDYKNTTPDVIVPEGVYGEQPTRDGIRYSDAVAKKSDLKKTLGANIVELLRALPKVGASAEEYAAVAQSAAILSEDYGDGFAAIPEKLDTLTNESGKKINDAKRIVVSSQACADAAAQYSTAAADYLKLYQQYQEARADSLVSKNVLEALRPVAEKSAMKTVEMRYKAGYTYEKAALMYLNAKAGASVKNAVIPANAENPVPVPIGDVSELVYLSAINDRFTRPAIEQAIKFYRAGLKSAAELGVMTENYAAMSEQGILELSQMAARRADSLARQCLILFDSTDATYQTRLNSIQAVSLQDTVDLVAKAVKLKTLAEKYRELISAATSEHDKAFSALKEITSPDASLSDTKECAKKFASAMLAASSERQTRLNATAKKWLGVAKKNRKKRFYAGASSAYQTLAEQFAQSTAKLSDEMKKNDVLK